MDKNTINNTNPSSPPKTKVKKESEEEIKEFAETAMNELLGWYGYERLELRRWAASRARDGSPERAEQKGKEECSWCNKSVGSESGALQQAGAVFCSELCFSQSRRANFKRAKTCDWCRHVRHTVAYVDFQDGATQLQFCSDKCLNQYKMHIFCRETQAHLDLNPHLVNASSSSSLITPDLWLKNCKSRSSSPKSERSGSPNPEKTQNPEKSDPPPNQRKSPLPLITIAPPAKLMNPKPLDERPVQKSPEAKKDSRNTKMNLRKRRTSKCSATVTSQSLRQNSTPKAQDMRMCSPSIDGSSPASTVTVGNSAIHSPPHSNPINHIPPFPNPMFGMPPPNFMDNPNGHINEHRHPMFAPRLGFMPPPPGMMHQERPRMFPPINFPPQISAIGQPPPVTVLVPYPVILPIPLPIPIPIPLTSFLQAHCANKVKTEVNNDDTEGPLDFTMNGDKRKSEQANESNDIIVPNDTEAPDKSNNYDQNNVNERIEADKSPSEATPEVGNPEQTLPKFKITRLGNKMAKIVAKSREPAESSRPLRKRRRLVEVSTDDDPLMSKTRKIVQV
ncbi:sine oculis-binding protein homolog [Maniola hyperantus]|uniref:sine oculis-binding protein homolog n=1 Tax=Aphantopus hyperantus TaxID=2795564 RepID=UPI001569E16F|nr:sine oculis-binding protein homolog [Maniola hyperantus]